MDSRVRRWDTTVAALALCFVIGACGGSGQSAAGPSAIPTGLEPVTGVQVLTITGVGFSTDPAIKPCSPPLTGPLADTMLLTLVDLRIEVGEWVARSTPGSGDVEFRFHPAGSGPIDRTIAGSVSGEARWASRTLPQRDLSARLGTRTTPLVADGKARRLFSDGLMHGEIVFADSAGVSTTCPDVHWSMQPDPPQPLLIAAMTR